MPRQRDFATIEMRDDGSYWVPSPLGASLGFKPTYCGTGLPKDDWNALTVSIRLNREARLAWMIDRRQGKLAKRMADARSPDR
jgi:hypothetical protein